VHEIKHDCYRLIARKQDGRIRLFSRCGYNWIDRYPLLAKAVAAIRASSATIDGEAVCCDESGLSIFEEPHKRPSLLQERAFAFVRPINVSPVAVEGISSRGSAERQNGGIAFALPELASRG
jgi:hypothetical protein